MIMRRAAEVGAQLDFVRTDEFRDVRIDANHSEFDFRGMHV